VRAVARLALEAHGFGFDWEATRAGVAVEDALGRDLARDILPRRLPELTPHLGAVARVPAMLALGYREATILHELSQGTPERGEDVGLLGAIFNAASATLDQVVDGDDRRGAALLHILMTDTVDAVFAMGAAAERSLERAARAAAGPVERLTVALVSGWARLGTELLEHSGNQGMWRRLGQTMADLLDAERGVATEASDHVLTRRKSEGPSLAIAQMVALARAPDDPPPPALWDEAERLGRVFCLVDDLADLLADARSGRPNILLQRRAGAQRFSDRAIYEAIYEAARELAAVLARPGLGFADEVVSRWLRWDEHVRRILPVAVRLDHTPVAVAGVQMLLSEQAAGYPHIEHALTFPRGRPGATQHETHAGVVFQRAVALDALLDAFDSGLPVPWRSVCDEGMRLLTAKHPSARGGWSYLPGVLELPPDADDLAAVVRALARLGGRPLASGCDEAVRLVLDAADASGGFPTWVLATRERQLVEYVGVVGGGGIHPDVVANLVSALALADPKRYAAPLANAARYVAGTQQPDGSWASAWYAGPYYGTFQAAAALAGLPGHGLVRARARAFLLNSQHVDGGWEPRSGDALSTALAVLGLCALDADGCASEIERGRARLSDLQEADGGWPSSPWIRFPTRDGVASYESRTMTTSFAVKALLAAAPRAAGHRREPVDAVRPLS
jgi:squalene-hopene/tetraprenyl-beta-curcumene cyclase